MGGKSSAPAAPDPYATAAATTQTNEATAAYNKALNLNNYTNPFGSQQTIQTGTDPNSGAPIYSTTTSANSALSQQLNSLMGQTGQSQLTNQNALNQLSGLQGSYANLYNGINSLGGNLSASAAQNAQSEGRNAAYNAQTQYLDPQFSQQQESLSAQLANQGLTPGSQAYNNAMTNFNNTKQQAYSNAANEAVLTGSQIGTQNWNNQLAGVNTQAGLYGLAGQQLGGMASTVGQQVGIGQTPYSNLSTIASMVPGYSGTGQSAAAPADIAGYLNNQYQGQLAGYNANTASANSTMGTLGTLGGAAMIAMGF